MRLYVAGPMTGYEEFNFPAFNRAAKILRACGYEVINPAEMDIEEGFDPSVTQDPDLAKEYWHAAMRRDIEAILTVDGVALLPGWENSTGAKIEVITAEAIGIPYASDWAWALEAQKRDPVCQETQEA